MMIRKQRVNISESQRLEKALEMIEDISTFAQTTDPERDWKQSYRAVIDIYEIIHSIRAPGCRKNHIKWVNKIDEAIIAEAR